MNILLKKLAVIATCATLLTPYEKMILILPSQQEFVLTDAISKDHPHYLHCCSCADDRGCFSWRVLPTLLS